MKRSTALVFGVLVCLVGLASDPGDVRAEEKDADMSALFVSESRVDEGPTIKRWQPKDRGRAHPINKRTSHLHIALDERN